MNKKVSFLLTEGFDFFSFSIVVETLRLANHAAKKELFTVTFINESYKEVMSSSGISIKIDSHLVELNRDEILIICGGKCIEISRKLLGWIRRQHRAGIEILSVHAGTLIIAKTGLLDGKSATIHWEYFPMFKETFPNVVLNHSSICVDGRISITAGGVSSSKRILQIIERDFGSELNLAVTDLMLLDKSSLNEEQQRLSNATRYGIRNTKLIQTISKMEANIEEPIAIQELAQSIDLSTRQLERLFKKYLNYSPHHFYLTLRLNKAKALLLDTSLSITEIAIACGFVSPSHFSKCFNRVFGEAPYSIRNALKQ